VSGRSLLALAVALVVAALVVTRVVENRYFYFAAYGILQYILLATAWNILGGYTGYVNFGTGAFFALGAYTSVVLIRSVHAALPVQILAGGLVSGLLGFGIGYLTLRLRGVYFSISTLALAVVAETFMVNWQYVGGSKGVSVIRPESPALFSNYVVFLFIVMGLLALGGVAVAWFIEHSRIGRGFAAIRDSEEAAECTGVPTLRLKLLATTISGALMGIAGAPFPYYITFVEPASAFNINYAVNSLAMPMVGGTSSWMGPIIGALLLGTIQQLVTVTISSELPTLIVGIVLVAFVVLAPEGILGLVRRATRRGAD